MHQLILEFKISNSICSNTQECPILPHTVIQASPSKPHGRWSDAAPRRHVAPVPPPLGLGPGGALPRHKSPASRFGRHDPTSPNLSLSLSRSPPQRATSHVPLFPLFLLLPLLASTSTSKSLLQFQRPVPVRFVDRRWMRVGVVVVGKGRSIEHGQGVGEGGDGGGVGWVGGEAQVPDPRGGLRAVRGDRAGGQRHRVPIALQAPRRDRRRQGARLRAHKQWPGTFARTSSPIRLLGPILRRGREIHRLA